MFDPRQRMMGQGQPMPQRPGWMQQLGQGLAAQQPMAQPMPQGGGGMPPQAAGPGGQPMGGPPPGAGFMRDQDLAIRAALARRRPQVPIQPQAMPPSMPQQGAPMEPDADQHGGPPDGDHDDPRARMGAYR